MHHFQYIDRKLHAESVSLLSIANAVGTPFYCYSSATLSRHVRVLSEAFSEANLQAKIHFAIKATPSRGVLSYLRECGCGMDAVSEGEIRLALAADCQPSEIIFSGVGKTRSELEFAIASRLKTINVESFAELEAIDSISSELGIVASIGIRLNPATETGNHAKIATGHGASKFGIPIELALVACQRVAASPFMKLRSLTMHIGSQITTIEPFDNAYGKLAEAARQVLAAGQVIDYINIGGGLGAPYAEADGIPPLPTALAEVAARHFASFELPLVLEPGRMIAANAGVLIGSVTFLKSTPSRNFVITDVGMNDLVRPTLYEAWHDIWPVTDNSDAHVGSEQVKVGHQIVDVVGPVCESGDYIASARSMPPVEPGDRFAVMGTGAYGAAMASEYNCRPRIAEVLVDGEKYAVLRQRRTYEEMLSEHIDIEWRS